MKNEKSIDDLFITLKYMKENGVLDIKTNEHKEIACLNCGGKIVASRASNGHLWVVCEKCGVLLSQ